MNILNSRKITKVRAHDSFLKCFGKYGNFRRHGLSHMIAAALGFEPSRSRTKIWLNVDTIFSFSCVGKGRIVIHAPLPLYLTYLIKSLTETNEKYGMHAKSNTVRNQQFKQSSISVYRIKIKNICA